MSLEGSSSCQSDLTSQTEKNRRCPSKLIDSFVDQSFSVEVCRIHCASELQTLLRILLNLSYEILLTIQPINEIAVEAFQVV